MKVLKNQSLAKYTNYQIGGTVENLFVVESVKDLLNMDPKILKEAYILGAGTNLLVSDKGVSKPVIEINLNNYWFNSADVLTVEAGTLLSKVAEYTAGVGLKGLVHVSGIPGSIGGAIVMNASASHGAISDSLVTVQAFNRQTGEKRLFQKDKCGFGFRESVFQNSDWIILNASFQMEPSDKATLTDLYKKIQTARKRDYPLTFPSAGCWFKRSWGGRDIIKKIGMVGAWRGKAVVSPMFPAFILNTGKASANDVLRLVKEIQEKAREIGEEMPLEIITWGEFDG